VQHLTLEDGTPRVDFATDPAPSSRPDVLILPPSLAQSISPDAAAAFTDWLRACHAEGTVLASVCAGAFLLGETGLLAGRAVTTHWTHAQAMQDRPLSRREG